MSSLCFCLTASTVEEALAQYKRNINYIDLVEVRVDLLEESERINATWLCEQIERPLILTIRRKADGGNWGENSSQETEENRLGLMKSLLERGKWDYVDLEGDLNESVFVSVKEAIHNSRVSYTRESCRIIRSLHCLDDSFFNLPLSEQVKRASIMSRKGEILKLAIFCKSSRDLLSIARLGIALAGVKKILTGMGEYGMPSRILAQRLGSEWTYASDSSGKVAAPGQLNPRQMIDLYRYRDIGPDTPLYAITGNPVSHSRSPLIHNEMLQNTGLSGTYLPIRSDDLATTLEVCDIWGISGVSVTVPHKGRALRLSDYVQPLAESVGAANTLVRTPAGWWAFNTDVSGFLRPLSEALGIGDEVEKPLTGRKVLVIGAGGAARAVVFGLVEAGATVLVLNRTVSRARDLAMDAGAEWGALDKESAPLLEGVDVAVQTTSAGMPPQETVDPLPWWDFGGCSLVYDLVYEPAETLLLSRAKKKGIAILSGYKMLEVQARRQFSLFTEGIAGKAGL